MLSNISQWQDALCSYTTLGSDDVLRLNHEVVTKTESGNGVAQIQVVENVNLVSRQCNKATAKFIHSLFNHASNEICYQSLLHTHGYEAKRLPEFHCSACAQANARRRGISHKVAMIGVPVFSFLEDTTYQDYESPSGEDSDDEMDYSPITDGPNLEKFTLKREPCEHNQRFDLDKLRPFSVMMADNKDFPCAVRGGYKVVFLLIDVKTQKKFVIKLNRKNHNYTKP